MSTVFVYVPDKLVLIIGVLLIVIYILIKLGFKVHDNVHDKFILNF